MRRRSSGEQDDFYPVPRFFVSLNGKNPKYSHFLPPCGGKKLPA
jgi:hypothetical protein